VCRSVFYLPLPGAFSNMMYSQASPYTAAPVAKKSLQVTVLSCTTLPNADSMLAKASDAYVIVSIPGKNKKFQTPVINDNLNPTWNHTDMIHDYVPGDSLEFQVMDKDVFPKPDDLLGKVTLHPQDFEANPYGMEGELPLEGGYATTQGCNASLSMKLYVIDDPVLVEPAPTAAHGGHAVPALAQAGQAQTLVVEIISGQIVHTVHTGDVNPYVVCQVVGSGAVAVEKKFQTPTPERRRAAQLQLPRGTTSAKSVSS